MGAVVSRLCKSLHIDRMQKAPYHPEGNGVVERMHGTLGATSPYAGGVQVGSPEPPFKINDIHSMHVVEVLVYTHLLV